MKVRMAKLKEKANNDLNHNNNPNDDSGEKTSSKCDQYKHQSNK